MKFVCERCGNCCHDIPLSKQELAMFHYILKDNLENEVTTEKHAYILKGKCPFLREDNLCDIYEFRPTVCKLYPIDGNCKK
jgi:Fe-S-cluster containining protein